MSVYYTVWMLHRAKTARLVTTLYRHITDKLPTSYQHITNCRPTVSRSTDSLCFGENLSAVCRPTDGRQMADSRPTVGWQTANSRPTDGRQSTDSRLTGFLGSSSSQLPVTCFLFLPPSLPFFGYYCWMRFFIPFKMALNQQQGAHKFSTVEKYKL